MDKKSKILLWIFTALIIISVAATYWRIMIKRDYIIEAQVDCDPYMEACFVWKCDPGSVVEGEACTGDPESDVWYFKVVKRNAGRIPLCDPSTDENCQPMICEEGEEECEEILCTEDQVEEQYASGCVNPEKYTKENPIEEIECIEGEEGEECETADLNENESEINESGTGDIEINENTASELETNEQGMNVSNQEIINSTESE